MDFNSTAEKVEHNFKSEYLEQQFEKVYTRVDSLITLIIALLSQNPSNTDLIFTLQRLRNFQHTIVTTNILEKFYIAEYEQWILSLSQSHSQSDSSNGAGDSSTANCGTSSTQ